MNITFSARPIDSFFCPPSHIYKCVSIFCTSIKFHIVIDNLKCHPELIYLKSSYLNLNYKSEIKPFSTHKLYINNTSINLLTKKWFIAIQSEYKVAIKKNWTDNLVWSSHFCIWNNTLLIFKSSGIHFPTCVLIKSIVLPKISMCGWSQVLP